MTASNNNLCGIHYLKQEAVSRLLMIAPDLNMQTNESTQNLNQDEMFVLNSWNIFMINLNHKHNFYFKI